MEYAGYVRRGAPDIGKAVGDIATQLRAVEAGREKRRDNLDKIYAENSELASKTELGMNPSFNNVMMNFSFDYKNKVYDWHKKLKAGEISERQYKLGMSNIRSGLNEFHTATKQKNNRFAEIEKLQRANKLGGRAAYLNELSAEMSTFKDYKPIMDEMGNMSMAKIDPKTGKVIEGTVTPVSSMNLTPNVINEKFVVSEKVAPFAKRIGKFTVQDGQVLLKGTSALESKGKWDTAKQDIITSVLNDDTAIGDALVDSGGYTYYSEGDGKPVTDKSIKLVRRSDKIMVPEPTPEQREAAKELVSNELDMQVGLSETKATTGKKEYTDQDKAGFTKNYDLALDIVQGNNLDVLKSIKPTDGGRVVDVVRTPTEIIMHIEKSGKPQEPIIISADMDNPDEATLAVYEYITGSKNKGDAAAQFELGKASSKQKFGGISVTKLQPIDHTKILSWNDSTYTDEKGNTQTKKGLNTLLESEILEQDKDDAVIPLKEFVLDMGSYTGYDFTDDDITVEKVKDEQKIKITLPNNTSETITVGSTIKNVLDSTTNDVMEKIQKLINGFVEDYNKKEYKVKKQGGKYSKYNKP
tara:strand:+ start:481 stop:2226 length:1746 start_codon:yes stop_codon:yes gene_type:complete